ncbi:hypothetical protein ACFE04_014656 [Oxalis oulophora]
MDQYIGEIFSSSSWSDVNRNGNSSWACSEPVESNVSIPNSTGVYNSDNTISNMNTITSNPMIETSTIQDNLPIILGAEPELQTLSSCQQWQRPATYGDVLSFSPAMGLNRIQNSGLQGSHLDDDMDSNGDTFIEMDKVLQLDRFSAYAPSEENQVMQKFSESSFAAGQQTTMKIVGLPSFQQTNFANAAEGCYGIGKPRVRARRGQATDPHSIAERLRREKISVRMKNLQELVPNSNKNDKASMLDEIIDYVKFLQLQVKVLSMSRLGAAGAVAPLITDNHSEAFTGYSLSQSAGRVAEFSPDQVAFEREVVKLMESNVTLAMQYLQSKGLCLMPVALAAAISSRKSSSFSSPGSEEQKICGSAPNNGSSSSSNSSLPGMGTHQLSPDGEIMVGNFNSHNFSNGATKLEAENIWQTPES